jgi:predicted DNA-binding antitoxin AbrB/MazE fold protein
MPQAITAVYENGVFIPRTKVVLPEHTTVKISIPDVPSRKRKKGSIEALFDLAPGGTETDVAVNHDIYLYGKAPL